MKLGRIGEEIVLAHLRNHPKIVGVEDFRNKRSGLIRMGGMVDP